MTDDEFLHPGRTFDGFQLIEPLGEGAMGAVWKATHLKLRRPVAIKFMKREAAKTPNARNRFLREGEAAARVDHDNVVKIHDVGVANDAMPYIVMELLDGEELRRRFQTAGPMPVAELVDLMLPVCAAVAAAHDAGIIHRDLKPENIFLARTRDRVTVPKVVDFGISRVADDASGRVNTGTAAVMGTPRYMSPEQVQGAKHVDEHTDQYALGVILYEGVTGEAPFNDAVLYTLFQRIVSGQCPPPRALRPDLPASVEAVILRAMAVYAERRFPSVRALALALLPFASERARLVYADRFVESTGTLPESLPPAAWMSTSVPPLDAPPTFAPPVTVQPTGHTIPPTMTTLGESAHELPAAPVPRPGRRVNPVLVAGLAALSLTVAAASVSLVRAPSAPVGAAPVVAAASGPASAQPALPRMPSSALATAPPAPTTPSVAPIPPPRPPTPIPPAALATSTTRERPAPRHESPAVGDRPRRGAPARRPLVRAPLLTAPSYVPPPSTTRGGAAID